MENQNDKENQLLSSGTQNKVRDTIESYRRTKNMLKDLSKNLKKPASSSSRHQSNQRPSKMASTAAANRDDSIEGIQLESDVLNRKIQRDISEIQRTIEASASHEISESD